LIQEEEVEAAVTFHSSWLLAEEAEEEVAHLLT
jgi:hypothetical protein